jgi:plastocyanin
MRNARLFVLGLMSVCLLGIAPAAAAQPAPTINMNSDSFDQTQVQIAAGQTVVWKNGNGLVHTVTADDSSFDSGDIPFGGTFSQEFDTPGTYPYYCTYHGDVGGVGMSGVIVVQ